LALMAASDDRRRDRLNRALVWLLALHVFLAPVLAVPGALAVYALDVGLGLDLPTPLLFPLALLGSVALFGAVYLAARRDGWRALVLFQVTSALLAGVLLVAHYGFAAELPVEVFRRFFP
jgi:hypothetical protein